MYKRSLSIFILSICMTNPLFAQEELLIKLPENSNHQIRALQARYGIKLRYRTPDFSIIQANRSALPQLPAAQILDSISPDFNYYLLDSPFPPLLGGVGVGGKGAGGLGGKILEQFDGFVLLKLHADLEGVLMDLPARYRAKLPDEMRLPEREQPAFAPSLSTSPQQQAVILGFLDQVDPNRWFNQIRALSENEDLERPGTFFRSRYSLRVRGATQFDGKPKPDGACDNAADYIAEQFRRYGLKVELDLFNHRRRSTLGDLLGDYVMRNVVATLPGKGPNKDRIYLMTGHYDSIASKAPGWEDNWRTLSAPGASDNASGIAEMLETARIISQQDFDFTIQFIAFSGEELFLFGSKHYRDLVKGRGDRIAGVLNFDLLGHDEDGILDIHVLGDEQSQWLVNAFGTAAERYNIPVDLRKKNDPGFIFSDHSPFWEIGIPAVMVSEESSFDAPESTAYVHSQEDTLAKITLPLGELAVKLAIATLSELARPLPASGSSEQTYPDIFWESRGFSVSNPMPTKGEKITIGASVKNAGPTDVTGSTIQFVAVRPDGISETLSKQTVNLGVAQSQTISATFTPTAWGIFTIRAVVNEEARVFESDFGNNRIETQLTVTDRSVAIENIAAYPNPVDFNQKSTVLKLAYVLSRDADVVIAIYTAFGEKVFERKFPAGVDGGKLGRNGIFTWSGRNTFGDTVAPGIYICLITAMDTTGKSRTQATKVAVQGINK